MASRSLKHSFDVYFSSTDDKDAFVVRLKRVREHFTPPGQKPLSYRKLMLRLLDAAEGSKATQTTDRAAGMNRNGGKSDSFCGLLLYSLACKWYLQGMSLSGIFTEDVTVDDGCLFVTERHSFSDLIDGLSAPCTCGMSSSPCVLESATQVLLHKCISSQNT